jgi:demethylmenaquinone methyltransferase/2-methoxy-6-polyprenyl-1,4-benzoquinol methylase
MLERGRRKADVREGTREILLVEADTQQLPFQTGTFGIVSVAFGIRNVSDTQRGIREMLRVLRPGGRIAILEFSRPRGRFLGPLYLTFFQKILPRIGQTIAPNRYRAYQYLPETVLEFPDGEEMVALLASLGVERVRAIPMTFGVATLYVGFKPEIESTGVSR